MTTAARRFDTDEQFVAYLTTVNPRSNYDPPNFDFIAATRKARALHQRLQAEFGTEVSFCGDGAVQDATYHAAIRVLPHCEIRLSNFDHLATMATQEGVSQPILTRIVQIIELCGYTYIPPRLFGEPMSEHFKDDLWTQLFEYI